MIIEPLISCLSLQNMLIKICKAESLQPLLFSINLTIPSIIEEGSD